ncbi:MAG: 2-hydroxychromene-2-carboxylate isomerase [Pseudomonadota bacterium]
MHHIDFHFDLISPYAYLAFHELPKVLEGVSITVTYRPVVFGAVLKHLGQLGPAEIPGKRDWTYRQVNWLARQRGLTLKLPASHPFNSLPLMRLATACDPKGTPNRHAVGALFDHVWTTGKEATDPQGLDALTRLLDPKRDPRSDEVKQQLHDLTESAIQAGVFGVPTFATEGQLFWGNDALPMLRAYLLGDEWFSTAEWTDVSNWPVGISRRN